MTSKLLFMVHLVKVSQKDSDLTRQFLKWLRNKSNLLEMRIVKGFDLYSFVKLHTEF